MSEVLERAVRDAEFRERLAKDPQSALSDYDLTADERAAFGASSLSAEQLEPRISKTDLSAAVSAKTSATAIPSRREGS
ncbi:MAG: hypothetical protein HY071_03450 [Chloroflexi bacterium]|nr:hypothetical protein [Chloroflexota bacterium]